MGIIVIDKMLMPNNRERTIDALARNNNIIKSLFHYDKPITFLIVSLAFQKIKINAHKNGLVVISRPEIKSLANGKNLVIGINKLIKAIRVDLESHNFFNLYSPNSGLTDIRQGLVKKTALTNDLFNDLVIDFDESLFDVFKSKKNYTMQSLNQLRSCGENQTTTLYTLTQPYAKKESPDFKLDILQLRFYLRVANDAYTMPRTLTMRVRKICQEVTKRTDINLGIELVKKNGTTGATIGYKFYSEFKKQKNNVLKVKNEKITELKPISIRQQLVLWGVGKKQIDMWLVNLHKKTLNDAIKQTLNRPKHKNNKSNAGGYIYSILGDGKQPQLTTEIKANEVVSCLKNFGLIADDIKNAQEKLKNI
jgi:hypothetical protein